MPLPCALPTPLKEEGWHEKGHSTHPKFYRIQTRESQFKIHVPNNFSRKRKRSSSNYPHTGQPPTQTTNLYPTLTLQP